MTIENEQAGNGAEMDLMRATYIEYPMRKGVKIRSKGVRLALRNLAMDVKAQMIEVVLDPE